MSIVNASNPSGVQVSPLPPLLQTPPQQSSGRATAQRKDVPVFEINYDPTGGMTRSVTERRLAELRGKNWQPLIVKPDLSAFDLTTLDADLQKLGVTDLILIGYKHDVCVNETAKSAQVLGYQVHVSLDTMQTGNAELDVQGARP